MLDASNLSKIEKLLVLTSAGNDNKFESLAKALMDHHALIHLDEKGDKKSWRQPHKGKGWKSHEKREYERKAYVAAHRDVDSDKDRADVPAKDDQKYDDESQSSEMSDAGCYFAQGNEDDTDPEPETKEEVELVVFTAYTADQEAMDEEQVAYLAQTEAAGFVAWNKVKGKGKGKGKGKFKKTFRFSHYSNGGRPPNRKSLEERKEALKNLKLKPNVKPVEQLDTGREIKNAQRKHGLVA